MTKSGGGAWVRLKIKWFTLLARRARRRGANDNADRYAEKALYLGVPHRGKIR